MSQHRHPLMWMPTLYFAMGVPMITVSVVASIMYKNLGLSNTEIALYTGSMYLPWVLKALWSPFIDMFKTKKFFVLFTELTMAISLGCIAMSLPLGGWLNISIGLFWIIGFLSATQDIAADGVYINAMTAKEQARWIGLQGVCWHGGRILASGLLVSLTGYLHSTEHGMGMSWESSWMAVMGLLGSIMLVTFLWHMKFLPTGSAATHSGEESGWTHVVSSFKDVFVTFFQKKDIGMMLAFILFYRLGEGLLEKLGPLFMIDDGSAGGLALGNMDVGNINGTFGSIAFILGALLGGWIASKFGLRRSLMFLCVMLNVPNLTYVYLSFELPTNIYWITSIITVEKWLSPDLPTS